jgi:hypothetical protein
VQQAINKSGDLSLTDSERLRYLTLAFFAPGHDPHVWWGGWYPEAMRAETRASESTPVDLWFAGGKAPILDLQAENDAVAPRKFSDVLKAALGDRVTVVVIPDAGHALVPDSHMQQPQRLRCSREDLGLPSWYPNVRLWRISAVPGRNPQRKMMRR